MFDSRVVRSRIFDDREKCVMGANVLHDVPISGSSVAHCAHASGVGHPASKTQASSPTFRCRIVRAKAAEVFDSRVVRSRIFDDREKCVMGAIVRWRSLHRAKESGFQH